MALIDHVIDSNGIQLHVQRTHTDKPPLIFAHGSTDDGLCFWPFAQRFADDYEVILYDSRYHGRSDAPEPPSQLIERAHDLAGLVEALDLDKPGVMGHSLGATTASLCAGLYPDHLGFVILEDPPLFSQMAHPDEARQQGRLAYRAFIESAKDRPIEELIATIREWSPTWPESEYEPWAISKQQVNLSTFDESAVPVEEAHAIVANIECPLLLITADLEKDALFPSEAADRFVNSLPNGHHVNIREAGHSIHRDQPQLVWEAIQAFLNTL